ncbi:hypothetical protein [Natronorarus salvus]|uniref:hypothetical protein n=1 Tax=Natronorarus salvus TaxID=3117733 RepID=UPI002F26BD45
MGERMDGRRNAMLTTEDRRWLTGEKSYSGEHAKQQRYQRRRDIRDRVRTSIRDFSILVEHLEEAERRRIFEEADGGLDEGVRDGLAFLLYSVGITRPGERERAEGLLADAIRRAGARDDLLVEEVDLSVRVREHEPSALVDALVAGETLSTWEFQYLFESGAIEAETLQACLRSALADADPTGGEETR